MFNNEFVFLEWIESKVFEVKEIKDRYYFDIKFIVNKWLYFGVFVKLNNCVWWLDREYDRSCVKFEGY